MKHINTILIVDDDAGARDTLEALLFHEGYDLVFAACGKEALEQAPTLIPSLILLDVMMPEMDGFEVCQQLRSMPLLAEVPIIMITALDDRESRLQGIRAGADDFISKPFDREILRARVRTVVRLNRYRRLHKQRSRFEWVIQQAKDGYVIIDEHDDIIFANDQACVFLGLPVTSERLPGDSMRIEQGNFLTLARKQYHLHPEDRWAVWPKQPDIESSHPLYLVRPETPTSDAFWLQTDILEVPSDPDMEKIVRLRDVTAQMNAERKRWGFHTMICHKLRTPLVGILGSLEFLASNSEQMEAGEVPEFADMALQSARRLHDEIEDILQYLSISNIGNSDRAFTFAEIRDSLEQVCRDLKLETVTLSIQDDVTDSCLLLSQQALQLVFWEILENSMKFHPSQRPVIDIKMERSGTGALKITIHDDGQTLSPEQLTHMWAPYYQGERFSTGEMRGMGLGLAIVSLLVWEIGGTCRAYNREDHPGIVIELQLPLVPCTDY